jgi:hypothetical protein
LRRASAFRGERNEALAKEKYSDKEDEQDEPARSEQSLEQH